ncbi:Dynein regulatory complex subunit 3 [Sparganum proliferum]
MSPLTLAVWNVRSLLDTLRSNLPERRTPLSVRDLTHYKVDIAASNEILSSYALGECAWTVWTREVGGVSINGGDDDGGEGSVVGALGHGVWSGLSIVGELGVLGLRVLNVAENPFCNNADAEDFILAFLPNLVYLDYGICDELKRSNAIEKYHLELHAVRSEETSAREQASKEEENARLDEKYKDAFIDGLENDKLFLSSERDAEIENVTFCLSETKARTKENCLHLVEDFKTKKNERFERLAKLEDAHEVQLSLQEYYQEISNLWNKLMGFEVSLMDQIDDIIKEFETTMTELVDRFIQNVEDYMGTCRDAEIQYHEQMSEHCFQLLERIAKNEIRVSLNEDLFEFFLDKDSVSNALAGMHDAHTLVFDSKADSMTARIRTWAANLFASLHEDHETKRSQERITEINCFIDYLHNELDNMEIPPLG